MVRVGEQVKSQRKKKVLYIVRSIAFQRNKAANACWQERVNKLGRKTQMVMYGAVYRVVHDNNKLNLYIRTKRRKAMSHAASREGVESGPAMDRLWCRQRCTVRRQILRSGETLHNLLVMGL